MDVPRTSCTMPRAPWAIQGAYFLSRQLTPGANRRVVPQLLVQQSLSQMFSAPPLLDGRQSEVKSAGKLGYMQCKQREYHESSWGSNYFVKKSETDRTNGSIGSGNGVVYRPQRGPHMTAPDTKGNTLHPSGTTGVFYCSTTPKKLLLREGK